MNEQERVLKRYHITGTEVEQHRDLPVDAPTGMYLELLHGRLHVNQQMDDWGFHGGFIGPLKWHHTTYVDTVRVCPIGEDEGVELRFDGDMLRFDGGWFGDWSIVWHQTDSGDRYLAVSWAHLSAETSDLICDQRASPVLNFVDTQGGEVFIHVMSNDAMRIAIQHCGINIPPDLQRLIAWGRRHGAQYLLLSTDAPVVRDLPTFGDLP